MLYVHVHIVWEQPARGEDSAADDSGHERGWIRGDGIQGFGKGWRLAMVSELAEVYTIVATKKCILTSHMC